MPKRIHKHARWTDELITDPGAHRFEHWCVDNQVHFITARRRAQFPAFASEQAKQVFWDRFTHYAAQLTFEPWITSLIDNHYHILGFLAVGENLKTLMQRLHGSVAKLVNDVLESQGTPRYTNFWRDQRGHEYFDGCLRDETQLRRTWRYIERQAERHGICDDWRSYPHTRATITHDAALKLAIERDGFMPDIPYKRYEKKCHQD
jgi:hypothetical protein